MSAEHERETALEENQIVVPVRLRIDGSQESHLAHNLNVTNHEVRLGGYRGEIKVEDEFVIQYRCASTDSESPGSPLATSVRKNKSGPSA